MCRELAMFWNKKQVLHKGTYSIIIAFSKLRTLFAREGSRELRAENSATFRTAALKQGGFRIPLSSCVHLW